MVQRAFSVEVKAEWIRAINVRININTLPYVSRFTEIGFEVHCLSKVPHGISVDIRVYHHVVIGVLDLW